MATSTGNCWCGNIKYEFSGEPAMQVICHCKTCQNLSGTAYTTNLLVPNANFKLLSGTPTVFSKHHEADMTLTISFCPECGTVCYKTADAEAFHGLTLVQAGTANKGLDVWSPAAELYVSTRAKWLPALQGKGQMMEFS